MAWVVGSSPAMTAVGGHGERTRERSFASPITPRSRKCAAIRIPSHREVMLQLNSHGERACYRIERRKSRGGNTTRRGRPCAH